MNSLVAYIEDKKKVNITNVSGAGVFILEAPPSHDMYRRCKAPESTLKYYLLSKKDVTICAANQDGTDIDPSASLEYLHVTEAGRDSVLPMGGMQHYMQCLMEPLLRKLEHHVSWFASDFHDDTLRYPCMSVSVGGGSQSQGDQKLRPWYGLFG